MTDSDSYMYGRSLVGSDERVYDPEEFMRVLHAAMARAGINDYAALCRLADLAQSNITKWAGGSQPGNRHLKRLARALRIRVGELLVASGHFSADDLSDGGGDVVFMILNNQQLPDATKLRLIAEWRRRENEARLRDSERDKQFMALISGILTEQVASTETDTETGVST